MEYLDGGESELNVEDIRGIWVASDDSEVVGRIKEIAPNYLPNVDNNAIFWASGGVEGGPEISRTATRTDKEVGGEKQCRFFGEMRSPRFCKFESWLDSHKLLQFRQNGCAHA